MRMGPVPVYLYLAVCTLLFDTHPDIYVGSFQLHANYTAIMDDKGTFTKLQSKHLVCLYSMYLVLQIQFCTGLT